MPLTNAFDESKTKLVRLEGDVSRGSIGGVTQVHFFGSRSQPELPHAKLSRYDPGRKSKAHFHIVDQFQVVVRGNLKMGRHDLHPYCVHFARAYTPYGPLFSDAETGFTFFVLRTAPDPGSQIMPEKAAVLKAMPNREPWQITREFSFPDAKDSAILLQALPDIKDDRGLAAYTLSMQPKLESFAPDPATGNGQYVLVLKGSLWHENTEHRQWSLVFVRPDEKAFAIRAGDDGLQALILNFPRPSTTGKSHIANMRVNDAKVLQCGLCAFEYDETKGWPVEGIAPGTRWEDMPDTWTCPDCGASKGDFRIIE